MEESAAEDGLHGGQAGAGVMAGGGGEVRQVRGGQILIAGVVAVMSPSLSNLMIDLEIRFYFD